ncbi:hypothetical protein AGMMS49975_17620 [Clostridia bacterium]|nr:hypothetical protein AGMMS49975_17620 [Clostridia bacterium]
MQNLVNGNEQKCVGCNLCVRHCPIEGANLARVDEFGEIKVVVDQSKCIACGNCVTSCLHGARTYEDDSAPFFDALASGEEISLIVSPSLYLNSPHTRGNLLAWFKELGIRGIYDAADGADIFLWAHLRLFQKPDFQKMILSSCPCIVNYCEEFQPELLKHFSPVQSPAMALSTYLRKHKGVSGKIASISSCISRDYEFSGLQGAIDYNLTYAKLRDYIKRENIILPRETAVLEHVFDVPNRPDSTISSLVFTANGTNRCLSHFLGREKNVYSAQGNSVYDVINEYVNVKPENRPDILDIMNCKNRCFGGHGNALNISRYEMVKYDNDLWKNAIEYGLDYHNAVCAKFDASLSLDDFTYDFQNTEQQPEPVPEAAIQDALKLLGKTAFKKRNINCGACGAKTCREMARRVASGYNIPENCVYKIRDEAISEHAKNSAYMDLIYNLGEMLCSVTNDNFEKIILDSLALLSRTYNVDAVSVWGTRENENLTGYTAYRQFLFQSPERTSEEFLPDEKLFPDDWINRLAKREYILYNKYGGYGDESMSQVVVKNPDFFGKIRSFLAIPLIIKEKFCGFLAFASTRPMNYGEKDTYPIASSGLLLFSTIIKRQLEENAYKDPLTGAYNRRYFMEESHNAFEKTKRTSGNACMLMMDLDFFKRVNDTYGHEAGDMVLVTLVSTVKSTLRSYDLFARYGGEEFVLMLPETTLEKGLLLAERIRSTIERTPFVYGDANIPITISIGIALVDFSQPYEASLKFSDDALYTAKKSGRNRVSLYIDDKDVDYDTL